MNEIKKWYLNDYNYEDITASPMSDSNELECVSFGGEKQNQEAQENDQSKRFGNTECEFLQFREKVSQTQTKQTRANRDK